MLQIKELIFKMLSEVNDNIYKLIDISIAYINQHMNWEVEFYDKNTARIEIPEVPVDAVREIVVNAFAHANYRSITEHEIDITPTMIDIYNPGEFPINYKPEDFAERRIQSMPRNKKILYVLYRSKNVEVQGSGIRKVLELCAVNNIKYEYYNNEFGFRFSFHRNNATLNVTTDVTSYVPIVLNNTDKEVLSLLKEKPEQTREEIASKIGKTVRTVQRSLDKLKEAKKITRIGNKNYGYWEIIE